MVTCLQCPTSTDFLSLVWPYSFFISDLPLLPLTPVEIQALLDSLTKQPQTLGRVCVAELSIESVLREVRIPYKTLLVFIPHSEFSQA